MDAKEKLLRDYAGEAHAAGFNCAECILDAAVRSGEIDLPGEARAMATGFGGGIGRTGNVCGALSAAIMVLGCKFGRRNPWAVPEETRRAELGDRMYRRYNRLVHEFAERNGAVQCRDLTAAWSANWQSEERRRRCAGIVAAAAELLHKYLHISAEDADGLRYGGNMSGRT